MTSFAIPILLTVHLLASNIAAAGPLLAAWLGWNSARADRKLQRVLLPQVATLCLAAGLLGILLGLAMLVAVVWFGDAAHRAALDAVPARRWWNAGAELAFYFIAMAIYRYAVRGERPISRWWMLLPVLAATDLLFHFPPLFVVIGSLADKTQMWNGPLERSQYWSLVFSGPVLAKILHHWLAGLATASIAIMAVAWRTGRHTLMSDDPADESSVQTRQLIRRIAAIGLVAVLSQFPIGIWVLLTMRNQQALLGEQVVPTILFALAVVSAVGLLRELALITLGEVRRSAIIQAAFCLVITVLLMALAGVQT